MVNLKKMSKMAKLSFDNALRLHFDTILLYKNKSYPTAYYLSVLAQEEIGKFYLLDDFVWHSEINGRYSKEDEAEFLKLIFFHSSKQKNFIFQGGLAIDTSLTGKKFVDEVFSNNLETKKQNAIYVGLPRNKGKINFKGRINNPVNIKLSKAKNQITIINDHFLDFISGVCSGVYSCDNEELEPEINRKLLLKLKTAWKHRSPKMEKWLKERDV